MLLRRYGTLGYRRRGHSPSLGGKTGVMRTRSDPPNPAAAAASRRLFGALHHRNFCLLWCACSAASLAQRMEGVLVGWLVLDLTDSAFLVGLVGSMRFLGALLGPVTGVLADRGDRRQMQIRALLAMTGIVATLLGCAIMQRLDGWTLGLATTLGGIVWAWVQPAQQSLPADFLSGRELVNGIALLNTAMNLTAILGPALGGALLAFGGPGVPWAYGVLLLFYAIQLGAYHAMQLAPRPPTEAAPSLWQHLSAGVRYSCSEAGLWTPLALAALVNCVAFPLQFGLLPVFARDVFQVGAAGLGLLGTALGGGAVLGSVLMAWSGAVHHAGRLMLWGTTGWFALLVVFACTPVYTLALGVLVLMGIAQTLALTNMTVLLLGTSSSAMRGRIMGLRSLAVAPLLLGGILAGAVTSRVGAPLTTMGCAVLGLLCTAAIAPWVPRRGTR
jgi:predicted MFS family arabinose efflux permease